MTTKIIVTTGHDYQNPKTSNLFYERWALGDRTNHFVSEFDTVVTTSI
ncbi:hypothetical protein LC609_29080 [Nostoc sp. XA013]|nr:hypothetical protein [Nostoc sp. XA013]